jgi:ABC-type Fe3+-hydroxamate transport system substrate-binding protein
MGTIPKKIVSLVPSQTELLFHLGLGDAVVGITKFCIHPAAWRTNKIITGGTKNINFEKISMLNPDLIIANKEENTKKEIEALALMYKVWVTDVSNLEEALQMISDIGSLTQTQIKATEIVDAIRRQFNCIHQPSEIINTCYLIWRNPYMTIGGDTFIHAMLGKCGLKNIFAAEKRYPVINISDLSSANCQLLILSSEPYPFKQTHIDEMQVLLPDTKIILANGEMFSWYGSRLLNAPAYFNTLINQLA